MQHPWLTPLFTHFVFLHSVDYQVDVRLTFLLYNGKAVLITLFREVLTTFFNEGMTSTKKAMCDKIRACATRVSISEDQVKVF